MKQPARGPRAPRIPVAEGPATCTVCGGTTHITRSPATGRLLAVDTATDLDTAHRCALGRPVALLAVSGGLAAVVPVRDGDQGASASGVLGGQLGFSAEDAARVERALADAGVVVLRRGRPAEDLFGGAG